MSLQLLNDAALKVVSTGAAAGETEVDTSIIDMAGYDSVLFLILLGTQTSTAVVNVNVQENDANQTSGMTTIVDALTGNNVNVNVTDASGNTDNGLLVTDVFRPLKRYVRAQILRTVANSQILGVIAVQYNGKKKPAVQDASVLASMIAVGS